VQWNFVEQWDVYSKLFEQSPRRFTSLCILLDYFERTLKEFKAWQVGHDERRRKYEANRTTYYSYKDTELQSLRWKLQKCTQKGKLVFKACILTDVLAHAKYYVHLSTYDARRTRAEEIVQSKQKSIDKTVARLEKMNKQHERKVARFDKIVSKHEKPPKPKRQYKKRKITTTSVEK
jgi:C4-dicarboxylate-specific signal transduction histidine kinase